MGIFDFLKPKITAREDNKSIVIEWLQSTSPINFDNGSMNLKSDVLYTDDYLSVFANVETTKDADSLIKAIIMQNGGVSNFRQEIRNGYELFYVGNKFSISWRFSLVGLIQVDIISRKSSLFDEFNTLNNQFDEYYYNIAKTDYLNNQAYINYDNGDFLEGINSIKLALEIISNDSSFLDTLSLGYYYLGDYKSAIEASDKCIQLDNINSSQIPEHYANRAKIYIKLNNIDNAVVDLKIAIKLDPDYEEANELLETIANN